MMSRISALCLGLSALASAGPAFAEALPDITGAWTFKTERYRAGLCQLYGTLHLRATPEDNIYRGAITAVEDCEGADRWVVEQTATAWRSGEELAIESTIVSFIEASANPENYAPDHFSVTIDSDNLMTGDLLSAVSAPVEFRRTTDGVS